MFLVTQANAKEMSSLFAVNTAAWMSLLTTEVFKNCQVHIFISHNVAGPDPLDQKLFDPYFKSKLLIV